jgi:hypothetical protein
VSAVRSRREAQRELGPYEAIVAHAELELELAGRGDVEGLEANGARWDELAAGLPAGPPAGAGALLERASMLHERARIEQIRMREALLSDVAAAMRASRAAEGYGGCAPPTRQLDRRA